MPVPIGHYASSWHTCWVLALPYYHEALTWVTGPIPQNPTCRPVKVVKVDVEAYDAEHQSAVPVIPDHGMMPEVIPKPQLDGQRADAEAGAEADNESSGDSADDGDDD
jgi:hypothetical protein